jgi:hypothetical protein
MVWEDSTLKEMRFRRFIAEDPFAYCSVHVFNFEDMAEESFKAFGAKDDRRMRRSKILPSTRTTSN